MYGQRLRGQPKTSERPYRVVRLADQGKVLLNYWATASEDRLQNLICVDRDGSERWRAALPSTAAVRDCFVTLKQVGGRLVASTWSGLIVEICPQTGAHVQAMAA